MLLDLDAVRRHRNLIVYDLLVMPNQRTKGLSYAKDFEGGELFRPPKEADVIFVLPVRPTPCSRSFSTHRSITAFSNDDDDDGLVWRYRVRRSQEAAFARQQQMDQLIDEAPYRFR
jgi:hypothetical protein